MTSCPLFAPRCGGPRARFFWCHGGRAEPAVHRLLWCRKDAAARRCCCVSGQLSPSPAAPRGCCSLRSSRPWAGWNCLAPCSASSGLLYSAMAFSCSLEQRLPGFHNRVQCSVVKAHNGAGKTVHSTLRLVVVSQRSWPTLLFFTSSAKSRRV